MCQKDTVICKEQVKDKNFGGLGVSKEWTQVEYPTTRLTMDVNAFRHVLLDFLEHDAEEYSEESGSQNTSLFHTILDREGIQEVTVVFHLSLLSYVKLLNDGKEFWQAPKSVGFTIGRLCVKRFRQINES